MFIFNIRVDSCPKFYLEQFNCTSLKETLIIIGDISIFAQRFMSHESMKY
jgi:hypothetical protein